MAVAKKYDWGLREVKTNVNIDVSNPHAENPDDPRIYVQASDLWKLPAHEAATLTALLKQIHANRQEPMAEINARPGYLVEDDVPYTDITAQQIPNDEENPYDI